MICFLRKRATAVCEFCGSIASPADLVNARSQWVVDGKRELTELRIANDRSQDVR
jgi:hypothetical protein